MEEIYSRQYQRIKCAHCPVKNSCSVSNLNLLNRVEKCTWQADNNTPISSLLFYTALQREKEKLEKIFARLALPPDELEQLVRIENLKTKRK